MIGKTAREEEQEECSEMTLGREATLNLEGERPASTEMMGILAHPAVFDLCLAAKHLPQP